METFRDDALQGRICLVTGGGTGIGREIARALARAGADVAVAGRRPAPLAAVAAEVRSLGRRAAALELDVRDPASVARAFERLDAELGPVGVLVNNAGANFVCPALSMSPNGWRAVLSTVLDGTFYCSREAARRMVEHGGGRIVNNAATNAHGGSPLMAHSGAAKAGVLSLTETLAVEWGPFGITVNAIAPGPVSTGEADERLWPDDGMRRRIAERVPLGGRMATALDCAGAVVFLASDAGAFVTGATLVIDGGERLRSPPIPQQ